MELLSPAIAGIPFARGLAGAGLEGARQGLGTAIADTLRDMIQRLPAPPQILRKRDAPAGEVVGRPLVHRHQLPRQLIN